MAETKKPAAPAPQAQKPAAGPYVHSLRLWLNGGQQFTLNEITDSEEIPANVVAFINAWREKKDVWHSPANDPHFGVRVLDVSLYEYRVGKAQPKPAEDQPKAE